MIKTKGSMNVRKIILELAAMTLEESGFIEECQNLRDMYPAIFDGRSIIYIGERRPADKGGVLITSPGYQGLNLPLKLKENQEVYLRITDMIPTETLKEVKHCDSCKCHES